MKNYGIEDAAIAVSASYDSELMVFEAIRTMRRHEDRLIDSVPDLIKALQAYLSMFEAHQITNQKGSSVDATGYIAKLARSAIDKATGRELDSGA